MGEISFGKIKVKGVMSVFLILGLSNGGLFLSRQLRKQWPDSIIYAVGSLDEIGQYSNTVNCFYPASSEDEILNRINDIITKNRGEKVKAFICSNPMLECVVLRCPELFEKIEFENDLDLYRRIVDKKEVDQLCRSLKMSRPEEYSLSDSLDGTIHFPVVVKPLEKANASGASKCAFLNTRTELKEYCDKLSRLGIERKNLVCQKCVKGDNRWEYGYGGYFKDGKPLIDIVFHQFIQVPQGLCCYSREMTDLSLRYKVLESVHPFLVFLEEYRYSGFLEFDIKQDQDSKVMYVLDINPRPWRSVDMLAGKLGDSTIFSPMVSSVNVIWRYPYRELLRRKNRRNVSYKLCKLIAPGEFVTQFALKDNDDKAPYQRQLVNDRRELLRLIRQKIHI